MEKSSQIAWKLVPLRHFSPLKVVPLIEVLLYMITPPREATAYALSISFCARLVSDLGCMKD
jgi:hypothetical protein